MLQFFRLIVFYLILSLETTNLYRTTVLFFTFDLIPAKVNSHNWLVRFLLLPRFTLHTKGLTRLCLLVPWRGFKKWPLHAACWGCWPWYCHGNRSSSRHDVRRSLGRLHWQRWLLHPGGSRDGDSCECRRMAFFQINSLSFKIFLKSLSDMMTSCRW